MGYSASLFFDNSRGFLVKQRGKKSAAGLAVVDSRRGSRPGPPAELSNFQAARWQQIVGCKPADWFSPDVLPLLTTLVRRMETVYMLDDAIDSFPVADLRDKDGVARLEAITKIRDRETRQLLALARSLRLTLQSIDAKVAGLDARRGKEQSGHMPWDA